MPFTFLSLGAAKILWAVITSLLYACLLELLCKIYRLNIKTSLVLFVIAYPLWIVHQFVGQVTVFLLLGVLSFNSWSGIWLSSKVLTLYPLFFRFHDKKQCPLVVKKVVNSIGIALLLTLPFLRLEDSLIQVFKNWFTCASSGQELGLSVLGRENQSLPALLSRVLISQAQSPFSLSILSVGLFICLWLMSRSAIRRFGIRQTWPTWVALSTTLQPLAWFHSFLLVIPLIAQQLPHWQHMTSKKTKGMMFLGILMLSAFTQKALDGCWRRLSGACACYAG
jgi:hypothetical protein